MTRESTARSGTGPVGALSALRVPNFARYFTGQLVSNTGTWFQNLTISLIVVQLTGSASALALVTVAQFTPILLLASFAGRLADTVSPRTILAVATGIASIMTLGLAVAVAQPEPSLPWLYGLILLSGCAHAFERVTAQAFVYELVGPRLLANGVVLSTVYISAARSIGPGLAGFAFLTLGPAACLVINAVSYAFACVAMLLVRRGDLHPRTAPEGARPTIKENIRAVAKNRPLVVILLINVFVTLFAMSMNVVLTSVVSIGFEGDAGALGMAHTLNAIGAVAGGIALARYTRVSAVTLIPACLLFSFTLLINAGAPTLTLFLIAAPLLGVGIGVYQGVIQSAAQAASPPHALGRTMSLMTMGNMGVAPFGALILGLVIDLSTGRVALAVGAVATAVAALVVYLVLVRGRTKEAGDG